jgi:hypothetical protein
MKKHSPLARPPAEERPLNRWPECEGFGRYLGRVRLKPDRSLAAFGIWSPLGITDVATRVLTEP